MNTIAYNIWVIANKILCNNDQPVNIANIWCAKNCEIYGIVSNRKKSAVAIYQHKLAYRTNIGCYTEEFKLLGYTVHSHFERIKIPENLFLLL